MPWEIWEVGMTRAELRRSNSPSSNVLFFIDLKSRRVHVAGCAGHPDGTWVARQARQGPPAKASNSQTISNSLSNRPEQQPARGSVG
jgi:hypothetical protein